MPAVQWVTSGFRWRAVGGLSRLFVPGRMAVTLGRRIYVYRQALEPDVVRHELQHVLQFEKEGIKMWAKYVWFFMRDWIRFGNRRTAYLENPYEKGARDGSTPV